MELPRMLFFLSGILYWSLILQAILLPPTESATNNITSDTDRLALLAFKAAAVSDDGGPRQYSMDSWNQSIHFCQWGGITCNRMNPERVIALDLESMNLLGSISPSIGNLTFLTRIHLPNNRLHGVIPSQIGRLFRLQYLNLSFNSLDGAIPNGAIIGCRNLVKLDLTDNQLSGNVPAEIGSLSKLTKLRLAFNNLDGVIPPSLGNLSSLTTLVFSTNKLTGVIPPLLGDLLSLGYLDLSINSLTGVVPPSFGNLSSLFLLDLSANSLSGVIPPQIISNLLLLNYLDLSNNSLTGGIPPLLGNLATLILSNNRLTGNVPHLLGDVTSLTYLDLSKNNLRGMIPSSFTNLSSLTTLDLSNNYLEGRLPEDLGRLASLEFLGVSENNLSGHIPLSLFNSSNLNSLSVVNNRLTGALPPNIGNTLPNLMNLNMFGNRFEGPIPISLANASRLLQIDLGNNSFSGKVPSNLGSLQQLNWLSLQGNRLEAREATDWSFLTSLTNCTRLEVLDLGNNDLGGILPAGSVANLSTQLKRIAMGRNRISGNFPQGIENLVNLTILNIEENLFNGSIPNSIGKLQNVQALAFFSNKFSGEIPSALGNLTQLNELYLDGNDLQGGIPSSLGRCQNLNALDLSHNQLIGSIPKEVLSLSSLSSFLDLSNNFLTGPLPVEVGRLRNLGELDVSVNRLSGEIPTELGQCQVLEYIYLESNSFQGTIPSSLSNLKGVLVLDLSLNSLSGDFPKFLADLSSLQNLNLSFNDLDGEVPNEGVLGKASVVSVLGNNKLCGGIPELHLPPCSIQSSKKNRRALALKVIVPVICGILTLVLLFGLFAAYLVRNSKKKPSPTTSSEDEHNIVSYADLLKATDEFSSTNLIGMGSYGSVYKGIMDQGQTLVAVKVLNLQVQGASKSFKAECEALRNIRHRNLVKILTLCSSLDFKGNEFKALVFELMPNGSLEKWLHQEVDKLVPSGILGLVHRLNIAIDVATALDYLHNHCETPIVHCDLKPSNVLLSHDMTAHVGDFGLARFLRKPISGSSRNPSTSSALKGSIGYTAPEYGMGGQVSTRADVYSYGILVLVLFTGKRPTDNMFKDGLTLHKFIEEEFSKGVMGIVDPLLLSDPEGEEIVDATQDQRQARGGTEQCLVSVIKIGLWCSKESPRERMEMKDVVNRMHAIRDALFRTQVHGDDETMKFKYH